MTVKNDPDVFVLEEATIADIHRAMQQGILSCRSLTEMYLKRIEEFDQKGPALNAVILVNPRALEIADEMDAALKTKGLVGPLHGIPLLLKDNVDTGDMDTTGGSLSLVRPMDLVAVGTDPVAAEAWGASLLGLGADRLAHIAIAEQLGLGSAAWRDLLVEA